MAERPSPREVTRHRHRAVFGKLLLALTLSGAACASQGDSDQPLAPTTTTAQVRPSTFERCTNETERLFPLLSVGLDPNEIPRLLGDEGPTPQAEEWAEVRQYVREWREDFPPGAEVVVDAGVAFTEAPPHQAAQQAGQLALLASQFLELPTAGGDAYQGQDGLATFGFVAYGNASSECRV